jgi:hypothetical protein
MHANHIFGTLRRAAGWPRMTVPGQGLPAYLHTLLGWRLTGLGLNPKDIEQQAPQLLAQLQSRCALCAGKRRCLEDMMDFRHPPGWQDYCPNAATIRALLAGADACRARTVPIGDRSQSA